MIVVYQQGEGLQQQLHSRHMHGHQHHMNTTMFHGYISLLLMSPSDVNKMRQRPKLLLQELYMLGEDAMLIPNQIQVMYTL